MTLGERIDAWCEATGLTYQDLADAAGISVAAVYQWVGSGKSKKTKPLLGHLEKAVRRLGVTMEEFYGEVPDIAETKASKSAARKKRAS